jgi:hypothetical protein
VSVRGEVAEFALLGPLPQEDADDLVIARHQRSLERIRAPLSDEEAALLVRSFGHDDCYGLAWTLLHLIETAPGGYLRSIRDDDNEWVRRLRARRSRAD